MQSLVNLNSQCTHQAGTAAAQCPAGLLPSPSGAWRLQRHKCIGVSTAAGASQQELCVIAVCNLAARNIRALPQAPLGNAVCFLLSAAHELLPVACFVHMDRRQVSQGLAAHRRATSSCGRHARTRACAPRRRSCTRHRFPPGYEKVHIDTQQFFFFCGLFFLRLFYQFRLIKRTTWAVKHAHSQSTLLIGSRCAFGVRCCS